jgi:hypothetical protein
MCHYSHTDQKEIHLTNIMRDVPYKISVVCKIKNANKYMDMRFLLCIHFVEFKK